MSKLLLYIFLFINLHNVLAQEQDKEELLSYQKKYLESAEKELKKSNELKALDDYHMVCALNLAPNFMSEYETISRKRIDSLLPKFQKKEIKKWIGKWKLKQLKTTDFTYEYIEITDKQILFYNNKNSKNPSRVEEIKFAKYDNDNMFILESFSSVEFKNNEIWEFFVEKRKGEKRLFPKIKNKGIISLDERHLIKDPKKRKEALAEEIRTYYVLEK